MSGPIEAVRPVPSCIDCGRPFVLALTERQFFESRGLALPKRCRGCRRLRRNGGLRARMDRAIMAEIEGRAARRPD